MVVEDDADCLEAVCDVLQDDGYTVVRATNGREALAALEQPPAPALILLDLMLPELDGWQFLEARKRNPALLEVPVVLLSGERDVKGHAARHGLAGGLGKPVGLDELLEMVHRVTGG